MSLLSSYVQLHVHKQCRCPMFPVSAESKGNVETKNILPLPSSQLPLTYLTEWITALYEWNICKWPCHGDLTHKGPLMLWGLCLLTQLCPHGIHLNSVYVSTLFWGPRCVFLNLNVFNTSVCLCVPLCSTESCFTLGSFLNKDIIVILIL